LIWLNKLGQQTSPADIYFLLLWLQFFVPITNPNLVASESPFGHVILYASVFLNIIVKNTLFDSAFKKKKKFKKVKNLHFQIADNKYVFKNM
jgi:hypothetical protein